MLSTSTFAPASPTAQAQPDRLGPQIAPPCSITVIGAGAFGGWTALFLLRNGYKVTLVDAWGAGNSRSSSGDETRVIRSTYGANETYFDLNVRALSLWKENQQRWGKQLLFQVGVLWFCYDEKVEMIDATLPFMKKHGLEYRYFSKTEAAKQYPQVNVDDLHHLVLDTEGGYLKAREGAIAVREAFVQEGGRFVQAYAQPGDIRSGKLASICLSDGTTLHADAYVFACGPWLGKLFPDILDQVVTCTKQEAYYFGIPYQYAGIFDNMPAWIDVDGSDYYYGIPGNASRGFKIGVDKRGEGFDPTAGERQLNPEVLRKARDFIGHRFPWLKEAPLAENRVCPYENSPDGNFILDTHPEADNCWFLGGGSGHGYKHGPALGELAAQIITGRQQLHPLFQLSRLSIR